MLIKLFGYIFILCIILMLIGFGFAIIGFFISILDHYKKVKIKEQQKRELLDGNKKIVITIKTEKEDNSDDTIC